MAEYTAELGKLIQLNFHPALDSYPIFDEEYRNILNTKIIRHYWFREIGQETADRFNFYLETKMWEIMPYYNQMYKSELLEIDPLTNFSTTALKKRLKDLTRKDGTTGSDQHTLDVESSENITGEKKNTGTVDTTKSGTDNNTRTDNLSETINTEQTTTNNLTTETQNHTTGEGTNNTSGNKNSTFRDVAQAPIPSTNPSTDGYITTQTIDTTTEQSETTSEENGTGSTTNTGTVTIDGEQTRTNSGTLKDERTTSDDETVTNNLTENTDESKTGTSKDTFDRSYTEQLERTDNETETVEHTTSGYQNITASDLLLKYRETFLNIDRMIIEELEPLFMRIY